jgi:recombination protein RecA
MGADREADLLDAACSDEATGSPMTRSGTWYSCNGERVAQGREGACTWLRENPKAAGLVETWMLMQANISRLTDRSAK